MFAVPQPPTKFLETLIFSLYNYGGNKREEFLLLNLFRAALEREIETKVVNMDDIVKNTPLALKFVVSYNRNGRGGFKLKQLLGPLIKQVSLAFNSVSQCFAYKLSAATKTLDGLLLI